VNQSEGTSFSQRSGRGGGKGGKKIHDSRTHNKTYWKDKECYKCHKKEHPATHCPKKLNDDDDISLAITAISVKKLKKDLKSMKKSFTTVNTQLEKLKEADSDISDSEGDDEASPFKMDAALQFAQVDKEFEPRTAKLLKQTGCTIRLDLREIILLDSQSTMDIFCNAALVSKTRKSNLSVRLKSNGVTIVETLKATMMGYNKYVWLSTRSITNVIALRRLIDQYHVTYDSDDLMFVVHQESESKPNMESRMHESVLHCYDPRKENHLTFFNTVSNNKEGFTKRHIKGA
jgi:hypothetical protein